MIDRDLISTIQHRTIPDSAGVAGSAAYTLFLSPTEATGTATSDGANAANNDATEVGREITLVDSAQTWTSMPGRRVRINSGALSGKVLQIVSFSGSTAKLRYVSSDASTVILTGVTYTVLADYTVGQKIVLLGVRPYRKATDGIIPESAGCSMRLVQNGGTRESWFIGFSSTGIQSNFGGDCPIIVNTSEGAPSFVFFKQIIGTTAWGTSSRFTLDFAVI